MNRIFTAAAVLLLASNAYAQAAPDAPKDAAPAGKAFVYTPKPTDVVIGKADAPVTIVEYASLSCPHCAHFYTHTLPELTTKYIDTGKAKLVYRDFPLNAPAMKGADLVHCADKDRRETFLKVLFTTQDKWAYDVNYMEALAGVAALGGISRPAFDACMADKKAEAAIAAVAKEASDVYKVSSTPTFYINGEFEKGDHDIKSMSKAIDAALAMKK